MGTRRKEDRFEPESVFPPRFEPPRCALSKGCDEVEKEFVNLMMPTIDFVKPTRVFLRSVDEGCPSRSERALC